MFVVIVNGQYETCEEVLLVGPTVTAVVLVRHTEYLAVVGVGGVFWVILYRAVEATVFEREYAGVLVCGHNLYGCHCLCQSLCVYVLADEVWVVGQEEPGLFPRVEGYLRADACLAHIERLPSGPSVLVDCVNWSG